MLELSPLFGPNAVLQCEQPLSVWGTADAGATIDVEFGSHRARAIADSSGGWRAEFPPCACGGPWEIRATDGCTLVVSPGVMLGEVWLCSGQSNMEWTISMLPECDLDTRTAEDPLLRCFTVPRTLSAHPISTLQGNWRSTTPEAARHFSATAYGFARHLRAATQRAVGIVVAAYGGTQIAAWLPAARWHGRPDYLPLREEWARQTAEPASTPLAPHAYRERAIHATGWETIECDDSVWPQLQVPGFWQDQGWKFNGAVWYRRTIDLPAHWRDRTVLVDFGACDDFDETFVNGVKIGGVGPELATAYNTPRLYSVPGSLTVRGRLTIAVRVFDQWGNGGIIRRAALILESETGERLPLEGAWRAKVEMELPYRLPPTPNQCPPCALYQGMIHPLAGFGLRGVLWYQGESNATRAAKYPVLLNDLIDAWREAWRAPRLAFGIVQLANYFHRQSQPGESAWADIREAQLQVSRSVSDTGLAVTIDVGEADNLHPPRKGVVGERLARWALAQVYRHAIEPWSGPLFTRSWHTDDGIYVQFDQCGDGLRGRSGGMLDGFQIAGADRQWRWADARIIARDTVSVTAQGLSAPVAVRYAWQDNPPCSLENSAGLPAAPFRTDHWPLSTD